MLNGKYVVCMAYLPIVLPGRRKYDDDLVMVFGQAPALSAKPERV